MRRQWCVLPAFLIACAGTAPEAAPPGDGARAKLKSGYDLMQAGKVEQAIHEFSRAIDECPHYAEAYYYRGSCYARLGRDTEALRDFDQALRYRPDHRMALYDGALVARANGDTDAVIRATMRMLEINPRDVPAYLMLGDAYRRQGNVEAAARSYYDALEIDREYVGTHGDPMLTRYVIENEARLRRAIGHCPRPAAGEGSSGRGPTSTWRPVFTAAAGSR